LAKKPTGKFEKFPTSGKYLSKEENERLISFTLELLFFFVTLSNKEVFFHNPLECSRLTFFCGKNKQT